MESFLGKGSQKWKIYWPVRRKKRKDNGPLRHPQQAKASSLIAWVMMASSQLPVNKKLSRVYAKSAIAFLQLNQNRINSIPLQINCNLCHQDIDWLDPTTKSHVPWFSIWERVKSVTSAFHKEIKMISNCPMSHRAHCACCSSFIVQLTFELWVIFAAWLAMGVQGVLALARTCKDKVKKVFTTNLDYRLEFKIIEFIFGVFGRREALKSWTHCDIFLGFPEGFNPLNENLLRSTSSKCFVVYFLAALTLWTANSLKNAVIDFSGDTEKRFSAMIVFFASLQVRSQLLTQSA